MMQKLGKAMGGNFDFPGMLGAGAGGDVAEAEEEEEEEEEETLHAAASAGESRTCTVQRAHSWLCVGVACHPIPSHCMDALERLPA